MSTEDERRARANSELELIEKRFADVPTVSSDELEALHASDAAGERRLVLVDAREPEELAASRIEGAVSAKEAEQLLWDSFSNDTPTTVVVYCTVGFRSALVARQIQKKFRHVEVRNYSVLKHLWSGGKLTDERVHIYSQRYDNMIPEGVETEHFSLFTAICRGVCFLVKPR